MAAKDELETINRATHAAENRLAELEDDFNKLRRYAETAVDLAERSPKLASSYLISVDAGILTLKVLRDTIKDALDKL